MEHEIKGGDSMATGLMHQPTSQEALDHWHKIREEIRARTHSDKHEYRSLKDQAATQISRLKREINEWEKIASTYDLQFTRKEPIQK